jgi:hypothetical protein
MISRRVRNGMRLAALAVAVSGCGDSVPPTSPAPQPNRATISIGGLQEYGPFLLPGARVQLRATLTDAAGSTRDCTNVAEWTSSNQP